MAHPPGFALYTLLGRLWIAVLPFLTPARALNLFSALTGALTLAVVAATVNRFARGGGDSGRAETLAPTPWPGMLAAAALGVSTTFWSQSTTANIRGLTGLFTALCLWALAQEGGRRKKEEGKAAPRFSFLLPASCFLFLSLGLLHHASLAFMGVIFGLYWLLSERNYAHPRRWLLAIGAALLPLPLLLYLPMRGAQGAFLAPPYLNTWAGFWEHVLATGFEGDFFYFAHLAALPDRLAIFGNILAFQFGPLLLASFALAVPFAFRRDRRYSLMLLAAFLVHVFIALTYRAPQTVEYLLPAYVVMAVALGIGTEYAIRNTGRVLRIAYSVLLALSVVTLSLRNLPSYLTLARDRSAREYAEAVLNEAPPGAAVLANWHWATPLWYLQKVEGKRPDVEVNYVFPQGDSLAETWVRRVRETLPARPVVVTSFYPVEYAASGYRFLPLDLKGRTGPAPVQSVAGTAWEVRAGPLAELPPDLRPIALSFGDRWRLIGYRAEDTLLVPATALPVSLAWQTSGPPEDTHFFTQLIGPDSALYAQADFDHPAGSYTSGEVILDRALLTLRPDSPPGEYTLIVGAVGPDGTRRPSGERDFAPLRLLNVGLASEPPVTRHRVNHSFGNASLVGYDFDFTLPDTARLYLNWRLTRGSQVIVILAGDSPFTELTLPAGSGYLTTATDLPPDLPITIASGSSRVSLPLPSPSDRYLPLGGSLILTGVRVRETAPGQFVVDLDWLSARPLAEDDIVGVSLVGDGWRAQSDGVPAGGAIPTLKWIRGSVIHDRHRLAAPLGATGPARLELAVYDHFTNRVMPILNPDVAALGATVPVGEVTLP
ncbi:MAG: DUF2723 domain-containing protein [Chloroflexi bacterium]|nr:DUF2723 domain-containing protein [Chloroflexota bacterium]